MSAIADYSAEELALVTDFLARTRELYEGHLERVRAMPAAEPARARRSSRAGRG